MRLLLVEDEEDLAGALRLGLERAGYAVDVAGDAADAYERLAVNAYDLMLLDINLPDADGFTICRALRRGEVEVAGGPGLRMLMLTARGGAARPGARPGRGRRRLPRQAVRARRTAGAGARAAAPRQRRRRRGGQVGDLTLDAARHAAARAGTPLRLTPKEFGVLEYLMTRPGHVVAAEELLEHVWDENADPFTETVRVTVGTLRRKLGTAPDGAPLIETVVGRGYRLREDT